MKWSTLILSYAVVSRTAFCTEAKPIENMTFHEHFQSKTRVESLGEQSETPSVKAFLRLKQKINFFLAYPGATFSHTVSSNDGTQIYKKQYRTDKFIRYTPQPLGSKKEHFIIAGDSNIFGIGSNDEETLSAQLARVFPNKKIYNLGISGSGPNTQLRLLDQLNLVRDYDIKEAKGLMIYDFNFYLIERITGSVHCIEWCKIFPFYQIDENQKLISKGTIEDHWSGQLYLFMKAIPYSGSLFPNFPKMGHDHLKLTVRILESIKRKYLDQTDTNNEFIVSINPNAYSTTEPIFFNQFIQLLKERNIKVITFPDTTLNYYNEDGHVSPAGHKIYADALRDKLKLAN